MFFNFKSFGKVIFLTTFSITVVSCGSFNNEARTSNNKAEINYREEPKFLDISASVIWDGSQTLGGNWVSHPNIKSPERVLIKNTTNGRSVVGAVFQQTKNLNKGLSAISSDAAKALGVSKNNETKLQIIAIKVIENFKDSADGTSTNVEKKPRGTRRVSSSRSSSQNQSSRYTVGTNRKKPRDNSSRFDD